MVDAEKCGLPRVLDTVEISCRTRHNIRLLCNLIYDHVFNLRLPGKQVSVSETRPNWGAFQIFTGPMNKKNKKQKTSLLFSKRPTDCFCTLPSPTGSKERLLEQRIPATYLALEDVVGVLAAEQKSNGRDPVLPVEQYRVAVATIMSSRFRMNFRDTAELNQVGGLEVAKKMRAAP